MRLCDSLAYFCRCRSFRVIDIPSRLARTKTLKRLTLSPLVRSLVPYSAARRHLATGVILTIRGLLRGYTSHEQRNEIIAGERIVVRFFSIYRLCVTIVRESIIRPTFERLNVTSTSFLSSRFQLICKFYRRKIVRLIRNYFSNTCDKLLRNATAKKHFVSLLIYVSSLRRIKDPRNERLDASPSPGNSRDARRDITNVPCPPDDHLRRVHFRALPRRRTVRARSQSGRRTIPK